MKKDELRKKYLHIREYILDKDIKSKVITDNILNLNIVKSAKTIALYNSINNEVDTNYLKNILLSENKIVVYPKVKNAKEMEFIKIESDNDFSLGTFNILEPTGNNTISVSDIDVMIIPGLCFDLSKNRIGYGKGYYDQYLKDTRIFKIGICYGEQLLPEKAIETNEFDIKMDYIITENGVY